MRTPLMSRLDGEHRDAKRRSRGRQGTGKTMPINIDKLTEAELIDLNHRIVERLLPWTWKAARPANT